MIVESLNVAAYLPEMANRHASTPAVICPTRNGWSQFSFEELNKASDGFAAALHSFGVTRGIRTVLMVPPSFEFFAITFAMFKIGAVPVLIDPGMGVWNLGKCLAEAEPHAFVAIPKAHLARRILGWARRTVRVTVTIGCPRLGSAHQIHRLAPGGLRKLANVPPFPVADVAPDEIAAILFTSGSTGPAKGVEYCHGVFASQVEAIRETFDIRAGEVDLATFPLFALFGPALGMTAVVPKMDPTRPASVEPRNIVEPVQRFKVTNLFGSPALLNRVGRADLGEVKLTTLRRVVSAGAPVPAAVIERFVRLLPPGTQVFTPYGATEALPVALVGSDEILNDTRYATDKGAGICIGRPVPGIEVRIIRISDEPISAWDSALELQAGQIGEIAVKGPWVTAAYYARSDATRLAKIHDPAGGFFHRMGDVGYFDDRGRIWFCGRKSQRVITHDGTLFTIPCEAVFNAHPLVFRSALVGVRRGDGVEPVICVEREQRQTNLTDAQLRNELLAIAAQFEHTRSIRTILFHPAFPVDIRHNSKIFREQLAIWAARRLR